MELSKKQTQLYAYQSQINPHFLYNMLQCMRGISLMHGIQEVAQICTNMADLFRYSIKGAFLVYLEDELSIVDKYLYMIRVRFRIRSLTAGDCRGYEKVQDTQDDSAAIGGELHLPWPGIHRR